MRRWFMLSALALVLVGALINLTIGADGMIGPLKGRPYSGYWYYKQTVVANSACPAGEGVFTLAPPDSAFKDTIYVARDFDHNGSTDAIGTSKDYAYVDFVEVGLRAKGGSTADTLWLRAVDNQQIAGADSSANELGTFQIVNANVVNQDSTAWSVKTWDFPIRAPRLVWHLSYGSTDSAFVIRTYHAF